MSDAAFKTAAFPGYTTKALRTMLKTADEFGWLSDPDRAARLRAEIERREAVATGDESQMTGGERLRFLKTGKAR